MFKEEWRSSKWRRSEESLLKRFKIQNPLQLERWVSLLLPSPSSLLTLTDGGLSEEARVQQKEDPQECCPAWGEKTKIIPRDLVR
jgi:hypothetical protein